MSCLCAICTHTDLWSCSLLSVLSCSVSLPLINAQWLFFLKLDLASLQCRCYGVWSEGSGVPSPGQPQSNLAVFKISPAPLGIISLNQRFPKCGPGISSISTAWNVVEMQILRLWSRPPRLETRRQRPGRLGANETSRWFWWAFKLRAAGLGLAALHPVCLGWLPGYSHSSELQFSPTDFLMGESLVSLAGFLRWFRINTSVRSWDFHVAYWTGTLSVPFLKYITALPLALSCPGWWTSLALNRLDYWEPVPMGAFL